MAHDGTTKGPMHMLPRWVLPDLLTGSVRITCSASQEVRTSERMRELHAHKGPGLPEGVLPWHSTASVWGKFRLASPCGKSAVMLSQLPSNRSRPGAANRIETPLDSSNRVKSPEWIKSLNRDLWNLWMEGLNRDLWSSMTSFLLCCTVFAVFWQSEHYLSEIEFTLTVNKIQWRLLSVDSQLTLWVHKEGGLESPEWKYAGILWMVMLCRLSFRYSQYRDTNTHTHTHTHTHIHTHCSFHIQSVWSEDH